jgi:hypothetical protein
MSMARIEPTIGRVVWYWPGTVLAMDSGLRDRKQPYTAQICFVNRDGSINIAGYKHDGEAFVARSVTLHQADDAQAPKEPYAEWMPYQKGQAAKTEALEKQLAT